MAPSLCWTSALVGCILLASLCETEGARQSHALGTKAGHVSHHHHSGDGHARSLMRAEFEGKVLPWKEDAEALPIGAVQSANGTAFVQKADQSSLFNFLASLFSRSAGKGTAVEDRTKGVSIPPQTNCHLSHDNKCNKPKTRLDTAIDFLFRKTSDAGQEILPADEAGKPAEDNNKGGLFRPSKGAKKLLPAHEGTKPAEADPAEHRQESQSARKRPSWMSFVKAFASAKTPGHAGADISTTSPGRPSSDGKTTLPADEGKGDHQADDSTTSLERPTMDGKQILPAIEAKADHPSLEETQSLEMRLSGAYAETRARMLVSAGSPSTSTLAQDFLAAHNAARGQVGVPPMVWNTTLAAFAQQWADYDKVNNNCAMEHRPTSGPYKETYGENVAWNGGFQSSATQVFPSCLQITNLWAAESVNYNYVTNTCAPGKVCGHWTAIVWRTSSQLGCAVVACPDPTYRMTQFWVCNYWPSGNIVGQRPY